MLKSLLKKSLNFAVNQRLVWAAMSRTVVPLADYSRWLRMKNDIARRDPEVAEALRTISPDMVVRHGPFAGLRYPAMKSVGSSLLPKLLGSYEMELHPLVESLCAKPFTDVVDVGCAEGYYAIGLGMRLPAAKVYAYDTLSEATALCRGMADRNGVADRLTTGAFCSAETLRTLPLGAKALIVCDCEGYETELFAEAVVPHLARHDILVEAHDFIDIETTPTLRKRFEATHAITALSSVDDIAKARTYRFAELDGYSLKDRKFILQEGRPAIMEWLYMTPL